ncbi:glucans biosynthesis glucosyltransferase MdoH [Marinomonas profundimaris]|uniref:Glucans biosynthesis glucosyltransferase H n=1 Tax=Marinomonas profundimaris TaxID=1208321 RepID=W1RVD6_9GAMM|nr:glucans biosynthesis glucosyltransferase MdoH [Marinomonas profundimaris]ETI58783.1 glucosyl transferase [Marinomonas profundimaris]
MLSEDIVAKRALPITSPLDMPRHAVNEASRPNKAKLIPKDFVTWLARVFVLVCTGGLSWYGATEMYSVLSTNAIAGLQWLFLVLFCINFTWISFAFSQATLGLLYQLWPFSGRRKERDVEGVTAILLPVYNEDPARIRANIQAMHADIVKQAAGKFAFFILSDTNKADAWIAEEQAFLSLLNDEANACPIFYRRRYDNVERKAGNIAEWVTNFGGDYECMIVLDADSLMGAECLVSLTRRMSADSSLGLIQTLPTIIRADTLYSRIQQFANHCFGPIYASGLAAWHGSASNFWGHNAIIRTKAFAQACGLPVLEGKAPFGGHVMSHDFMEAALLRRAGWGVRFDTDLKASYEEAPPSLVDVIVRDRRWCQGNLQHKAFVFAKGFHFATRLHLFSGIMSYLSAVFWLMLIVVGFALAVQAYFVRPEYFSNPSLFPTWPVFDFEKARALFILSMILVLAPKAYGWLAAMLNIRRCMQFGGPILLTLSILMETLLSALYAPILMLSQFQVVYSVFKGADSGWKPQSRDDGATPWKVAARAHFSHTVFGVALAGGALFLSPQLFYWSLPISFGLVLSIPLSWLSGGTKRGNVIHHFGLLRAPEEKRPHEIVALQHRYSTDTNQPRFDAALPSLIRLIADPALFYWHLAQMPEPQSDKEFCRAWICAEWQILNSESIEGLLSHLREDECIAILQHRTLMVAMQKYLPEDERVNTESEAFALV